MKKLIPPILFLLCIVLMIIIKYLLSTNKIIDYPFNLIGITLIILGLVFTILVKKQFEKNETEIHTFKTPSKFVTDGLFKYSRNPIYLGFTIALVGIWLVTGNLVALVGVLIFFLISNFWYIPYEEKIMENEFGNEYKIYKSRVRRWI